MIPSYSSELQREGRISGLGDRKGKKKILWEKGNFWGLWNCMFLHLDWENEDDFWNRSKKALVYAHCTAFAQCYFPFTYCIVYISLNFSNKTIALSASIDVRFTYVPCQNIPVPFTYDFAMIPKEHRFVPLIQNY